MPAFNGFFFLYTPKEFYYVFALVFIPFPSQQIQVDSMRLNIHYELRNNKSIAGQQKRVVKIRT